MSRIGKKPIDLPQGVEVTLDGARIVVKGAKGELSLALPATVSVKKDGSQVTAGPALLEQGIGERDQPLSMDWESGPGDGGDE